MKREDYVKYLTERFITYLDTPRDERKKRRVRRRKSPRSYHWFGDIPFSFKLFLSKQKQR